MELSAGKKQFFVGALSGTVGRKEVLVCRSTWRSCRHENALV